MWFMISIQWYVGSLLIAFVLGAFTLAWWMNKVEKETMATAEKGKGSTQWDANSQN